MEFAAVGTGSEEYVRDLIFSISNPGVAIERPNSQPWCKCGVCISMPDPEENKELETGEFYHHVWLT